MISKLNISLKDPDNYRPIGLLPILGKILEKIILKTLTNILETRLRPSQFGFRADRPTGLQTLRHTTDIAIWLQGRKIYPVLALFLDYSTAFDTVNHNTLLYKIRPHIPFFLHLSLKTTSQTEPSKLRTLTTPLPLDLLLPASPKAQSSPQFYSPCNTNDLPTSCRTNDYIFVDDTALTVTRHRPPHPSRLLQQDLDRISTWATDNNLQLNPQKLKAIFFHRGTSHNTHETPPPLSLDNNTTDWSNETKYLGVTLTENYYGINIFTTLFTEPTQI